MNDLIKINYNNEQPTVSGRELHEFLEVGTKYTQWIERMFEYGFSENVDFAVIPIFENDGTAFGGQRKSIDHELSLDMAKEISMLQRADKGKKARQYFINVEKAWNDPDRVIERANRILQTRIANLELRVKENAPKVLFADSVSASQTSISVGEMAKILKQNGVGIGEKRFFEWLRDKGYLIKRKGTDHNMPTQYSMERKLFEIKETTYNSGDNVKISKTPKVTGKGQLYFANKLIEKESA